MNATARCAKRGGHFIEIGKYDLQTNSAIPSSLNMKCVTFHGVQVDELWLDKNKEKWSEVSQIFQGDIVIFKF